ncbi:hypothetical protein EYF80_051298 [Liparis tanakae]|uniref:Uncharacterized protein n=1 Tax=Liparis tanakae TaxID=230148 RepID=A0A4Z2FCA4_9TELE|nr:hypothetical protein EYF80_051298 [Liparis tanakae]
MEALSDQHRRLDETEAVQDKMATSLANLSLLPQVLGTACFGPETCMASTSIGSYTLPPVSGQTKTRCQTPIRPSASSFLFNPPVTPNNSTPRPQVASKALSHAASITSLSEEAAAIPRIRGQPTGIPEHYLSSATSLPNLQKPRQGTTIWSQEDVNNERMQRYNMAELDELNQRQDEDLSTLSNDELCVPPSKLQEDEVYKIKGVLSGTMEKLT